MLKKLGLIALLAATTLGGCYSPYHTYRAPYVRHYHYWHRW